MKNLFFTALFFCFGVLLFAQNRTLNKVIQLTITSPDGHNGAEVAYHLTQKKYYAAMAGNADFPMSIFDAQGHLLSTTAIGFDVRGMWYNTQLKSLQANGYSNFGWASFVLDENGLPTTNTVFVNGQNQPTEQSVAAFNNKEQKLYFLKNFSIVQYDINGSEENTWPLFLKTAYTENTIDTLPNYYNATPLFTGIANSEIGLLNNYNHTVELYNLSTGKISFIWQLPNDVPVNAFFNFSYTNGIVWLFDKELRIWYGYK